MSVSPRSLGAVALPLAAVAGYAAVMYPLMVAAIVCAGTAIWIWWRASLASSALLAGAILVLSAGLLLPSAAGALAGAGLLSFVAARTATLARDDPRWVLGLAALLVVAFWIAGALLNPNSPGLGVGLLGTRKMTLTLVGLAAGALWPIRTVDRAETLIVAVLVAGAVASLVVHLAAPGFESLLTRAAGEYTSLFRGSTRMQGIYPGPFHVALLGTFLALLSWHRLVTRSGRPLAALAILALGIALMYYANVRTAYVTLAVAVILTAIVRPPRRIGRTRVLAATAVLAAVTTVALSSGLWSSAAIQSIPDLMDDNRAAGRVSALPVAWRAITAHPVAGLGPGSAGAAMQTRFAPGGHVGTDDQFVAIAVEGGAVGVILFAVAGLAIALQRPAVLSPDHASAAAALALFGFMFTGNVFEALPVSLLLAMLIGLRCAPAP